MGQKGLTESQAYLFGGGEAEKGEAGERSGADLNMAWDGEEEKGEKGEKRVLRGNEALASCLRLPTCRKEPTRI